MVTPIANKKLLSAQKHIFLIPFFFTSIYSIAQIENKLNYVTPLFKNYCSIGGGMNFPKPLYGSISNGAALRGLAFNFDYNWYFKKNLSTLFRFQFTNNPIDKNQMQDSLNKQLQAPVIFNISNWHIFSLMGGAQFSENQGDFIFDLRALFAFTIVNFPGYNIKTTNVYTSRIARITPGLSIDGGLTVRYVKNKMFAGIGVDYIFTGTSSSFDSPINPQTSYPPQTSNNLDQHIIEQLMVFITAGYLFN